MTGEHLICVIEPQPQVAPALAALVSGYGLQVRSFRDAEKFCGDSLLGSRCCVLLDADAVGAAATVALRTLRGRGFTGAIIALGSQPEGWKLREAGATDVISRTLVVAYLLNRVGDLLPGAGDLPQLESHTVTVRNGTPVTFRIMRPQDAKIEQAFVRGLSDRSRYLRFFSWLKELSPSMLESLTHPDFPVSYAIIATIEARGEEKQIAVGRYAPTAVAGVAEYAVVVADEWQGQGIATHLMHGIILACAISGFHAVEGLILRENAAMIDLARKLGFEHVYDHVEGPGVVKLRKQLVAADA